MVHLRLPGSLRQTSGRMSGPDHRRAGEAPEGGKDPPRPPGQGGGSQCAEVGGCLLQGTCCILSQSNGKNQISVSPHLERRLECRPRNIFVGGRADEPSEAILRGIREGARLLKLVDFDMNLFIS